MNYNLIEGRVYNLENSKCYYVFTGLGITQQELKYMGSMDAFFQFHYINKFGSGLCYKDLIFVKRLIESSPEVQLMYGK